MNDSPDLTRRDFIKDTVTVGTAVSAIHVAGALASAAPAAERGGGLIRDRKVRVAVIGCGNVTKSYFPTLLASPYIELVSTCDIIPQRAEAAARKLSAPHHFPHIDKLLAGPPFDLLVNLTDMQQHFQINRQALLAGKHVWSEKPLGISHDEASSLLELAKEKGVRILGAPTVVASPQFAFMAQAIREGKLGRISAAHASYGHLGPSWSSFFYDRDGGSLFDLGVYNIATLTGLLEPAKAVVAMTSVVTPTRTIAGRGQIRVAAEDNAMLIIDHGGGTMSHIQCGFNFYYAKEHSDTDQAHHTLSIIGSQGTMHLAGYDWAPHGVDLATRESGGKLKRFATDAGGYEWQCGAAKMAEMLATGAKPRFTAPHAAHVADVIAAAHQSQATGKRVEVKSTFEPIVLG
ncbi:MAG: Gfo/Idh/MocA family oxidoreductase [Planctomycetes bacterium]|nr:Gfo/Idh/MocA family oxidoreductase [Planctomycetota bacterium]